MTRPVVLLALSMLAAPSFAADPPPPGIDEAIRRATASLRKAIPGNPRSGSSVLAALAIVKSGEPAGPEVEAVLAAIGDRCSATEYRPEQDHYYTAGLELMLLEAVDAERYRREMEKVLAYVVKGQKNGGGWYYPNQDAPGDTSITQYATLGLWAASRAGLDVPRQTWDKLAVWHLRTQLPNGAFTYHPGQGDGGGGTPNPPLTIGGASSLLLAKLHLFGAGGGRGAPKERPRGPSEREAQTGKRFGVLEAVNLDDEPEEGPKAVARGGEVRSTSAAIQQAVDRAVAFTEATFALPPPTTYRLYYLYGLERMAALGDVRTLGPHDWYAEGATWLLATQQADGSWSQESGSTVTSTAFAVLFLSRSTAKALGRAVGPAALGGGLLAGGRGLPDDLGRVNVKDGDVKTRSTGGPLDELLARLEDAKAADVPGVQQGVLEAVRFGDREKLIGERERLLKLVNDPRPEVRRTAHWALGRGGELWDVPVMIAGLSDADVGVAVEAHNALCVFARRPLAFGIAADPLAEVPEGGPEADRAKAVAAWREKAVAAWKGWYSRVAPYEERDGLGVFR